MMMNTQDEERMAVGIYTWRAQYYLLCFFVSWHAWIEVMDAMHLFNTRANTNKNKSAENE
jgi:hypothetical protein